MGEWLKGRRDALFDAVLIYVVVEWVGPQVIALVVFVGSSSFALLTLGTILGLVAQVLSMRHDAKLGLHDPERVPEGMEWVTCRRRMGCFPGQYGGPMVLLVPKREAEAAETKVSNHTRRGRTTQS